MTTAAVRARFLNLAALVEGFVCAIAFALGWLIDVDPLAHLHGNLAGAAIGALAALPLFGLFLLSMRWPIGPLAAIRRIVVGFLGPPLAACRWHDLVLLAALAGFSEELLFRGVLQPWFEVSGGRSAGLIGSNVAFGLMHAVTPTYAIVAGLLGGYLGWLLDATGERQLLTPIVAHAVYDYLGFLLVRRAWRRDPIEIPADQDPWRDPSDLDG